MVQLDRKMNLIYSYYLGRLQILIFSYLGPSQPLTRSSKKAELQCPIVCVCFVKFQPKNIKGERKEQSVVNYFLYFTNIDNISVKRFLVKSTPLTLFGYICKPLFSSLLLECVLRIWNNTKLEWIAKSTYTVCTLYSKRGKLS